MLICHVMAGIKGQNASQSGEGYSPNHAPFPRGYPSLLLSPHTHMAYSGQAFSTVTVGFGAAHLPLNSPDLSYHI